MSPWPLNISDEQRRGHLSYYFTMPGVSVGSNDVSIRFDLDRRQWHVIQQDDPDGPRWEAWGESRIGVVLDLLRARLGLVETEGSDE